MPELVAYNKDKGLNNEGSMKNILIMGDSFTAGQESYPYIMQRNLRNYRIINSGLSGTGAIQASIIAPKRFKKFKPSIFIYQIYVGNDLFDITYPVNWRTLSFSRNMYWKASNYFRSISFLNYRLGQISAGKGNKNREKLKQVYSHNIDNHFSAGEYNKRERLYIKAEPLILENHILVKGKRKKDFYVLLQKLEELVSYCKRGECEAYILVIPHACQVNECYLENMTHIGSIFNYPKQILKNEYPFIKKIREIFKLNSDVHVLNPIRVLKDKENENKPMYYHNDGHLNQYGQKVIADFVIDQINLN
ncbi:MAG: hypothetical protein ACE5KZ_08960 [Candidatus Scalinduaceae bacterium]